MNAAAAGAVPPPDPDTRGRTRVLVVEDDQALRALLADELGDAGYEVATAGDAQEALACQHAEACEIVISDLRLPGQDGLALLSALQQAGLDCGFIMITGFGTVEQAVEALKQGADDFLTKPLKLDHLRLAVSRVLEHRRLRSEVTRYRELLVDDDFHGMIGRSEPMRRLFDIVQRVAGASGPVLILGESGTGKELVARAIHAESDRAAGPFVAINCAGIPAELMESELFGHVSGAFTGARQAREGLFMAAQGGTLLLDEIGEMPIDMQAKLLRVLEDGTLRPVGGNRELRPDVRVLAATHRDLETQVREGGFREDLFFRLETFQVVVPPLRERGEDVDLLAARLVARFGAQRHPPVTGIAPSARALFQRYPFPGNVRELSNALERAVAFCQGEEITAADLPERLRRTSAVADAPPLTGLWEDARLPTLEQVEQRYIHHVLASLGGNKRRAAQVLGIGRRTLYRRLGLDEG
ncbi:MAG: sigma-54-dependent Fis family transcriptional regulator [Gammaproteobacteria bacterium]|nr:sigma-54-dependent Fis family transcriptional regulator [Gammaproteobacteria bacterium]